MNAVEEYKRSRQILFDAENIQPQSKIVDAEGPVKNIHYLEMGRGDPLILIHGGGSHASEWLPILKPLAEHFHLYAVDRPGHGLTGAFDYKGVHVEDHVPRFLNSFMDAIGLNKASFLGHSMGGYFSLVFALQCPERVRHLLLIGAPAGVNRWIPLMLRMLGTKGLNGVLTRTVAKPSLANMKTIYKKLLVAHPERLSDGFYRHCYDGQKIPGYAKGFTSLLENALTFKGWRKDLYLGDRLHDLSLPVGFIWGEKDVFEKPFSGRQKALQINNHRFEIVKDAGHSVWLDQPEECVKLINSMFYGLLKSAK